MLVPMRTFALEAEVAALLVVDHARLRPSVSSLNAKGEGERASNFR